MHDSSFTSFHILKEWDEVLLNEKNLRGNGEPGTPTLFVVKRALAARPYQIAQSKNLYDKAKIACWLILSKITKSILRGAGKPNNVTRARRYRLRTFIGKRFG
jgi:hypothetical protein